ncbi:thiamine diphosphokinase [Bacillus sp. 2205SS5-2]|uniref:thiamine diphosphokinase n=1 Tax=Bacillus sp. 2205SS5-2 TaxID=3109031 RepID=UPI0030048C71
MELNIYIVGGGPQTELPLLSEWNEKNVLWVGVDKGVYILLKQGIIPERAFGDFDSVSQEEWEEIQQYAKQINQYQPEKDETDMELALNWAVKQNPDKIRIFGGTGGRLDHFMANIQLLIRTMNKEESIKIELIDRKNRLNVFQPGHYTIEKLDSKRYISFFPVSQEVRGLTLSGFKYELINHHISLGSTLCISNELIQFNGTFSFSDGILLMVRSED